MVFKPNPFTKHPSLGAQHAYGYKGFLARPVSNCIVCRIKKKFMFTPDNQTVRTRIHWHNPPSRAMAPGLATPLTEISTRNISWGVKAAGALGWQPYHLHVPIVLKSGSLNLLEPSGPVQACNEIVLPFPLIVWSNWRNVRTPRSQQPDSSTVSPEYTSGSSKLH